MLLCVSICKKPSVFMNWVWATQKQSQKQVHCTCTCHRIVSFIAFAQIWSCHGYVVFVPSFRTYRYDCVTYVHACKHLQGTTVLLLCCVLVSKHKNTRRWHSTFITQLRSRASRFQCWLLPLPLYFQVAPLTHSPQTCISVPADPGLGSGDLEQGEFPLVHFCGGSLE